MSIRCKGIRAWALISLSITACADGARGDTKAPMSVQADAGDVPAPERHDAGRPAPQPASYVAVADIIERSCAYIRCHDGPIIGATLPFRRSADNSAVLFLNSCEYPPMKRIEPYDPDNSWLFIKLTAQFRGPDDLYANFIYFEPKDPGFDPDARPLACAGGGRSPDGTVLFGTRMPATAPNHLADDEIEAVRQWIMEGAPHTPEP
jgi:hypothetical protein